MAFAGLHVVFGYAGGIGGQKSSMPLMSKPTNSQTRTSAGFFSNTAPAVSGNSGQPMVRLYADADWWVAVGPNPNSAADPRTLIPAKTTIDLFCDAGDQVHGTIA